MQVIGFCRFSYPALGGFQVTHDTIETRRAYLYAPERMETRFRQFEAFTLPSIAGQTDADFTFLILIGDDLPAPYLGRLRDLVAPVPQIKIIVKAPQRHREICQKVINAARNLAQPCLQFRHDDDDALALSFVARLRSAASDVAPLLRSHRLVGFDFNRGFVARPDAQGIHASETVTPYWGVALAMAVQANRLQSIMNFGHAKLNRFMPTVTFTDTPMYVRGHNAFNDSRQKDHVSAPDLPLLDAAGERRFRETFGIDADHVRRLYGGS